MSGSKEPPLDEVQWRSPQLAADFGGIHSDNVLFYFSNSPFFDVTSNNQSLVTQATHNPNMAHFLHSRQMFESGLRTMSGVEFMVAPEASAPSAKEPAVPASELSGVWLIRKQNRRKRNGMEDEVAVLSSYFVVGENIYMAPSVANVIAGRMLSTITSLTNLLSTATSLPIFSPSYGHTYIAPTAKQPAPTGTNTRAQSPQAGSLESTPIPESMASQTSKASAASATTTDLQASMQLASSFDLSLRYGGEYMDENPLVGEPGSFILSTTRPTAGTGKANEALGRRMEPAVAGRSAVSTPQSEAAAAKKPPSPVRKSSKEKVKRRKSKGGDGDISPISPS